MKKIKSLFSGSKHLVSNDTKIKQKLLSLKSFTSNNNTLFSRKKNVIKDVYYPVPATAERPSPPSQPEVFQEHNEYFVIRWEPPVYDGGCPIIGYIIQHVELGIPNQFDTMDDTECWYSSEPGQVTLTECLLHRLVPGTTYQFRILAENLLGFSSPSELSEPIVFNPYGDLDDWFTPPRFIQTLEESYSVYEHERVTLAVEVAGQPFPWAKWFNAKGEELKAVRATGSKRICTLDNVRLSDGGRIRCTVQNCKGAVECYTQLVVHAPPRIEPVENTNYKFQVGEVVKLKFKFSGTPKPTGSMYKDGSKIDDQIKRISLEVQNTAIVFKIIHVESEDSGKYSVILDNGLGEDTLHFSVLIIDRPDPPSKPEILQLSDNTCILQWKPAKHVYPIDNYIVEYFREDWSVWLTAMRTKRVTAKIKDLIPGSKYRFRIKAENMHGMSDASPESVDILITDSKFRDQDENLLMKTLVEEDEEEEEEKFEGERQSEDEDEKGDVDMTDKEFFMKLSEYDSSFEFSIDEASNLELDKLVTDKNTDSISSDITKNQEGEKGLLELPKDDGPARPVSPALSVRERHKEEKAQRAQRDDKQLLRDLSFDQKSESQVPRFAYNLDKEKKREHPPSSGSEASLRSPSLDKLTDYISMKVAHKNPNLAHSLRHFSHSHFNSSYDHLFADDETTPTKGKVSSSTPNISSQPKIILMDELKPPPVVITECSLTVSGNSQVQLWRSDVSLANDQIYDEENVIIKDKPVKTDVDYDPPPGLIPMSDPPQKYQEIYHEIIGKNIGRTRNRHNSSSSNIAGGVGNQDKLAKDAADAMNNKVTSPRESLLASIKTSTVVTTLVFIILSPLLFINIYFTGFIFLLFLFKMFKI